MRLIGKFNRLIRNRTLWGAFAVLVSVSFVGAFSQTDGCMGPTSLGAGRIFGETISRQQFYAARHFAQGLRPAGGLSDEEFENLEQATWQRLAALRWAEKLDIFVSDDELNREIRRVPMFNREGTPWDGKYYRRIVRDQYGVSTSMFEEFLRQAIVLERMSHLLNLSVWVTPSETLNELRNWTDVFSLQYAVLRTDELAKFEDVTLDRQKDFYESHPDLFMEPEALRVRYVAFPVEAYLSDEPVDEAQVAAYYQAHGERLYGVKGTNGVAVTPPLDEVREKIEAELKRGAALAQARKEATDLVMALAPSRYSAGLPWDEAVQRKSLNVHTSEFFSAGQSVPGLAMASDLLDTAFSLVPDEPTRYFSGAMEGSNAVYVLAAHERRAASLPEFERALSRISASTRDTLVQMIAAEKAGETADKIRSSLAQGKSLADSLAVMEFTNAVSAVDSFSVYEERLRSFDMNQQDDQDDQDDDKAMPHAEKLLPLLGERMPGDLLDPVKTDQGYLLVVVTGRKPGDTAAVGFMRPSVHAELNREKVERLYPAWNRRLLALADFSKSAAPSEAGETAR
jgi:hypothetical protein